MQAQLEIILLLKYMMTTVSKTPRLVHLGTERTIHLIIN